MPNSFFGSAFCSFFFMWTCCRFFLNDFMLSLPLNGSHKASWPSFTVIMSIVISFKISFTITSQNISAPSSAPKSLPTAQRWSSCAVAVVLGSAMWQAIRQRIWTHWKKKWTKTSSLMADADWKGIWIGNWSPFFKLSSSCVGTDAIQHCFSLSELPMLGARS